MPTLESHRKTWIPKRKQSNKSWTHDSRYHTARWRNYRVWFLQIAGISGKAGKLCVYCREMNKAMDYVMNLSYKLGIYEIMKNKLLQYGKMSKEVLSRVK
jgi:hypothetical protein